MKNVKLIKLCAEKYLNGYGTLTQIQKDFHVNKQDVKEELENQGYIISKGVKLKTVINLKLAMDEYKNLLAEGKEPSLTKLSKKYEVTTKTISKRIKEEGFEIINYQNRLKFNENKFDTIDTEEKAYWLGFLYADGNIAKDSNNVELSLSYNDIDHLKKFNIFMEHEKDIINISNVTYNDKVYKRCRWIVNNKHLHDILNNLGCIPAKSLILKFPDISIFKDKSLIRHFIRGYVDGNGSITYNNKEHTICELSILGTEDFLTSLQEYIPKKLLYKIHSSGSNAKVININGQNAFNVIDYLYSDSTIYLQRKYEKYIEFCRLYQ